MVLCPTFGVHLNGGNARNTEDLGCQFSITEAPAPDDDTPEGARTFLEEVVNDALDKGLDNLQVGADPGFYSEESAAALETALANAQAGLEQTLTAEEYNALRTALEGAISGLQFNEIEDGYYYIVSADDRFESTYGYKKAFHVWSSGWPCWVNFHEDEWSEIFEIKKMATAGQFTIRDIMRTGDYFTSSTGNNQRVQTNASTPTPQTFTFYANGQWTISNTVNNIAYHCKGHDTGAGAWGNIITWQNAAYDFGRWYLRRVTDEAKLSHVENKMNGKADLMDAALRNAEIAYNTAFSRTPDTANPYITEASTSDAAHCQFFYNYIDTRYGNVDKLIDGDMGTWFITTNNVGKNYTGKPYIGVDLRTAVKTFSFDMSTIQNASANNWAPSNVNLYASNDKENWVKVAHFTTTDLPQGSAQMMHSRAINMADAYRYLKFEVIEVVNATNNGSHDIANVMPQFAIGELQVYPLVTDEANSPYYTNPTAKTAADNLSALIATGWGKVMNETYTQADIDALNNGITAIQQSIAPTYTVHITGAPEGTYVTIDGNNYTNGESLQHEPLTAADVTPQVVENYLPATVTVTGTDINVVYAFDWDSYFAWDDKYVIEIGEELTGTVGADPDQWYLLKSNRDGISPVYDRGAGKAVVRDHNRDVAINDAAKDVKQYLVRLVPSAEFPETGAVNIQMGTGRYFQNAGTSGNTDIVSGNNPISFVVYTSHQKTSGWIGHHGFSETTDGTTKGRRLDTSNTNGDENTANRLMYWGTNTGEGDCSVFALYPVTLGAAPDVTYDITIIGAPEENAKVTIAGNQYGNGEQITCTPLTAADVTVPEYANYAKNLVVSGTDVKLTYYVNNVAALSNNSMFYVDSRRGTLHYNEANTYVIGAQNETFAENADKFVFMKGADDATYMYNVGGSKYIGYKDADHPGATGAPSYPVVLNASNSEAYPFYLTSNARVFNLVGDHSYVRVNNWGPGWSSGTQDDGNRYRLIYAGELTEAPTIDILISDANRGTFATVFPLDFTGLDVWGSICTGVSTSNPDKVVMSDRLAIVDACTPLYVGADAEGTYAVPVYMGTDFSEISGTNYLAANLSEPVLTIYQNDESNTKYILQKQSGDAAPKFYKVQPTGNTVGFGRCYLQLPGAPASAKEVLDIEDDPTGINNIVNGQRSTVNGSYNLTGVKVGADYRGVVIVNGRKEIRK